MKLTCLLIVLLAVTLTQQNNFIRNQHTTAENHQIFENSWFGTSDSACDKACKARNYNVCGSIKKECCKISCQKKWWRGQYCADDSIVQDLTCSVLNSITGSYWSGTTCDNKCNKAGGKVCGKTNKECCATGCDTGTFTQTCQNSQSQTFNCTSLNS